MHIELGPIENEINFDKEDEEMNLRKMRLLSLNRMRDSMAPSEYLNVVTRVSMAIRDGVDMSEFFNDLDKMHTGAM